MGKKVIVAPLDWGLGHATRCIPIVHALHEAGHEVFLGVTDETKKIFDQEFKQLVQFPLAEHSIHYFSGFPAWFSILLHTYHFKKNMKKDHSIIQHLSNKINADVVISDNRYGCFSNNTKNIFITHQLTIKTPILNHYANHILKSHLKPFSEIWIPDFSDINNNLSGELSHGTKSPIPIRYLNPLSRLKKEKTLKKKQYKYCFLISGPENGRSKFEKEAIDFINAYKISYALIRGTATKLMYPIRNTNGDCFDLADAAIVHTTISSAEFVVCRSGYSTIMDLVVMKKPAYLYPTPGQSEQIYLSQYLSKFDMFSTIEKIENILTNHEPQYREEIFDSLEDEQLVNAIKSL